MLLYQVTGGGNGLGRSLCLKLADLGCNVAVVDIDIEAAENTAEEVRSKGLKAKAYKADVTKKEQILKLRNDSLNDLGPIDILVSQSRNNYYLFFPNFCALFTSGQQCGVNVKQESGRESRIY